MLTLLYLIDGYNLLHFNEELNELSRIDLSDARDKLINIVCDFAGYVNAECILVFDAYKNSEYVSRIIKHDNITIVYTKNKQTADEYIEIKSKELIDDYKIIVVTSDALVQLRIFANGAFRMSCREFYLRYDNLKKNYKKINYKPNRPLSELRLLLNDEEIG